MGTGGPFPGGKARPRRDADHSPPSSAEVVNEYELYLLSPQAPPWRVERLLYFLLYVSFEGRDWEKQQNLSQDSLPQGQWFVTHWLS
jgi:hypothetical protein